MNILHLLNKWEKEWIISVEQKESMQADLKISKKENTSGKLTTIVSVIGALLVGIWVILFFASNWWGLGRMVKLLLIVLLPIIPLVIGYILSERKKNYPILGKSLIFLAMLLIGASIALFFQLYNLNLNPATILLIWLIFVTPFTFIIKSGSVWVLHTVLLILWINFQFIFNQTGWWGIYYPDEKTFVIIELILGLVLLGVWNLIQFHTKWWSHVHKSYRKIGLAISLLCGFIFTTGIYTTEILDLDGGYRLLFNVLYIAFLAWTVFLGIIKRVNFVISQAFFWIAVYLISLYFDFFWGLMDRSLSLITIGILALVGWFYLERYRRALIKSLHANK